MAVSEERIQQLEATLRSLQNPGATDAPFSTSEGGGAGSGAGGGSSAGSGGGSGSAGSGGDVVEGSSPSQGASAAQAERLLTLARVTLRAGPGDLLAIVGQVGHPFLTHQYENTILHTTPY